MKHLIKYIAIFISGGIGYGLIEILWRGRTHYSMLIAGGAVFCFACFINSKFEEASLILKTCVLSLMITTTELFFGLVFNMAFDMNVWNYSSMPFNFFGQICLLYSVLWTFLSFAICLVYAPMKKALGFILKKSGLVTSRFPSQG